MTRSIQSFKSLAFFLTLTFVLAGGLLNANSPDWITEKYPAYTLRYTLQEENHKNEYLALIDEGIKSVESFFNSPFQKPFEIVIHPDRSSLDAAWQKQFNLPEFKSECWMVASGDAFKLDMISPMLWETESCEHHFTDMEKTQKLITHELVHVFHGQWNKSPDFSETSGMDWFVEGMAAYVSGQCDEGRMSQVRTALEQHKLPEELANFWTGQFKYGLSGSMIMYLDTIYGKQRLLDLLKINCLKDLLAELDTTESVILFGWTQFMNGHFH